MIAKVRRGGGFLGCLNYVFRTRKEDTGKYEYTVFKSVCQIEEAQGTNADCPVILKVYWHGAYCGTISDRGSMVRLKGFRSEKMAGFKAAEIAAQKGWKCASVTGNDNFVKYGFEYLLARGIEPKAKNKAQAKILDQVRRERAQTGRDQWKNILPPKSPAQAKPTAPLLVGGNMCGNGAKELSQEFGLSRRARPGTRKPVWHCSISLAPGENLQPEQWAKLADKFMQKMEFTKQYQYIAVQHFDKDLAHIHIVASRIGMNSNLWIGNWEAHKAHEITNILAAEFGLQQVEIKSKAIKSLTPGEIGKFRRTGDAPEKLQLQQIIATAMSDRPTIEEFLERLEIVGVTARPNIAQTGRMNGFSFGISGSTILFSGSKLGKKYTWMKLREVLNYEPDRDNQILNGCRNSGGARGNLQNARAKTIEKSDSTFGAKNESDQRGAVAGENHNHARPKTADEPIPNFVGKSPEERRNAETYTKKTYSPVQNTPASTRRAIRPNNQKNIPVKYRTILAEAKATEAEHQRKEQAISLHKLKGGDSYSTLKPLHLFNLRKK